MEHCAIERTLLQFYWTRFEHKRTKTDYRATFASFHQNAKEAKKSVFDFFDTNFFAQAINQIYYEDKHTKGYKMVRKSSKKVEN